MVKNVVVCLDGTNNKIKSAGNTNVVRLFDLLDLDDPLRQVAYYDPGVGTFSSPAAWTPPARLASRLAGLAFGAGLRQNLGEACTWLMSAYEPGDRVFVFGFSRGVVSLVPVQPVPAWREIPKQTLTEALSTDRRLVVRSDGSEVPDRFRREQTGLWVEVDLPLR